MECVMNISADDYSESLQNKVVTARRPHVCEECLVKIEPGTKYEIYKGVYEGGVFTVKTCMDCVSIRESFFKDGASQFGNLLDTVSEHIAYGLDGEVDSKCIIPLTDVAKGRVFGWIEEAWER